MANNIAQDLVSYLTLPTGQHFTVAANKMVTDRQGWVQTKSELKSVSRWYIANSTYFTLLLVVLSNILA